MDDAPLATRDAWLAMVASTLKDGDVGRLKRRTPDGLTIQALYTAADAPPAAGLALPARDADRPWDVRTATAHPDPAHANREILDDLEGGAASVAGAHRPGGRPGRGDRLGRGPGPGARRRDPGAGAGRPRRRLPRADGRRLAGRGGQGRAGRAARLPPRPAERLRRGRRQPRTDRGAPDRRPPRVGARLAEPYPKASLFLASGRAVARGRRRRGAGARLRASPRALAYAKALDPRRAADRRRRSAGSCWASPSTPTPSSTIAKLRAARLIWARLTSACGARRAGADRGALVRPHAHPRATPGPT